MKRWIIRVACPCGDPMGSPIPCTMWDVHSRLAAVRDRLPPGWTAEAYPEMETG